MIGGAGRIEDQAIDLAATLAAADDAFIGWGLDRTIATWNPAAERLYGHTAAEAIGQPMSLIVPPEQVAELVSELERVLAGGSGQIQETVRRRKDGSSAQVSVGFAPIRGTGGGIIGVLSIHRDIGERIRERDDLRRSSERLALSQRVAGVGSWEFDIATGVVTWSAELYRIYGRDPSTFVPSYAAYLECVHPADRERVAATVGGALESCAPARFEHRIVLPDGSVRVLRAHAEVVPAQDGRVARMFGTGQDITALALIQDEVRRQNETLELVSRATNDAVWERVIPGATMIWHHGLEVYGYSPQDIEAMSGSTFSLVHPDDVERAKTSAEAALAGQAASWSCQYRLRRADQSYATVLARGFILRDPSGAPVRFVGSLLDLTEHERAEELDRRNAASAAVLARASHELRTPLNAILGFSELLAEQLRPSITERQLRYLHNIRAAGSQLLGLVDDVLDLSKAAAGRIELSPERVGLAALLEPVVASARERAAAKGVGLSLDVAEDPALVLDAGRVRQILDNLLSNAVQFTPAGGAITLRAHAHDGALDLMVTDTGVGIPPDKQGRVFGAFERLHEDDPAASGPGLGLALTRELVELHGGSIDFVSVEGQGTSFTVAFPDVVVGPIPDDRILVVEDRAADADLIVALAAGSGLTTEVARTLAEARRAIARALPRAVVLDLRLPDGRGEELLEQLRSVAATRMLPVIVVSGDDGGADPDVSTADDRLGKPIDHGRLRAWFSHVSGPPAAVADVEVR